jgi:hypothetical protein
MGHGRSLMSMGVSTNRVTAFARKRPNAHSEATARLAMPTRLHDWESNSVGRDMRPLRVEPDGVAAAWILSALMDGPSRTNLTG